MNLLPPSWSATSLRQPRTARRQQPGKPQKNVARSNHVVQNNSGGTTGLLRRKEVTEEEAER